MGAIIILGGHRSGTSITARLVHALGFPAAPSDDRLLQPRRGCERDNPDGYFEDVPFVRLHRRMLGEPIQSLGGWRNPRRDDAAIDRLLGRYRQLVRERNAHAADWCLKDPRLCLVGDVLFGTLRELRIDFQIVSTVRPLTAIAASLMRRGLVPDAAMRLAGEYEAGRRAMLDLAGRMGARCLEICLTSRGSHAEIMDEVRRLQGFLGKETASTGWLASLVRP